MRRLLRLSRDRRGVAAVEFAIVAPVLLLLIMGGMEVGHTMYVNSVMLGMIQKAGRDMSLENGGTNQQAIEDKVTAALNNIVAMPTPPTYKILSYHDYKNAANPAEEFGDADHDGVCDHGETYVDSNGNGHWDADGSVAGRGGSKDVVLLQVDVRYPRLALGRMFSADPNVHMTASTLLRNQPSTTQSQPATGICP
jgi:Flp pilus assembly pilin Flp